MTSEAQLAFPVFAWAITLSSGSSLLIKANDVQIHHGGTLALYGQKPGDGAVTLIFALSAGEWRSVALSPYPHSDGQVGFDMAIGAVLKAR